MARLKPTVSTTSAVDEKISVEVEGTAITINEDNSSKKQKSFSDDDKVRIKCLAMAGRTAIGKTSTIEFDEKGIAIVKGIEAKRLLSIPGYSLA